MTFPIHASDVVYEVDSDEEATMLVIEAINDGTFDDLEFAESVDPETVRSAVTSWDGYTDCVHTITAQKKLLSRTIANASDEDVTAQSVDSAQAQRIAEKAIDSFAAEKIKTRPRRWIGFSAAACILFICFSVGFANIQNVTQNDNEATQLLASAPSQEEAGSEESDAPQSIDSLVDSSGKSTSGDNSGDGSDSIKNASSEVDNENNSQVIIAWVILAVAIVALLAIATYFIRKLRSRRD